MTTVIRIIFLAERKLWYARGTRKRMLRATPKNKAPEGTKRQKNRRRLLKLNSGEVVVRKQKVKNINKVPPVLKNTQKMLHQESTYCKMGTILY